MPGRKSRLLALNDVRLMGYLHASEETLRAEELTRLLTAEVQPRARSVLESYVRTEWPIEPQDVEDILGQVTLSVLRKLRAAMVLEEESIQNLEAYVVTLTRNAVRDFMRRRSPQRTRMKSRLRYLFTHDDRFAIWFSDNVMLCGLARWRDATGYEQRMDRVRAVSAHLRDEPRANASLLLSLFAEIGQPVRFTDLVSGVVPEERQEGEGHLPDQPITPQRDLVESRQYLEVLWTEIRELPARQRAALLLNLREPGSGNAVLLFVAVGLATIEEIADTIGMTPARLSELWDRLPLDDLTIGEHLGITRQQVINLRKSARQRLARRMALRGSARQ